MYEDGTRDCPGCKAGDMAHPHRITATMLLCLPCERRVHNDVMAGLAQIEPFMRRHLAFTDFLIENGHDLIPHAA